MSLRALDERDFWDLYERELRGEIGRACVSHARRLGHAVDPDDMVSWIDCRVWKLLDSAPNPIIVGGATAADAVARVQGAMPMLVRWAYLSQIRKATRLRTREQTADQAAIESLGRAKAAPAAFERSETVRAGLDALRSRVSADVRSKLAASWPDANERERIADALDVNEDADRTTREEIEMGNVKDNTVHQMRSRSLKRARGVFEGSRDAAWKFVPMLLVAAIVAVIAVSPAMANDDDDDGEQTGGRSAPAHCHFPGR
ncbi:MAG: hypothetical protein AAF937_00085 [Planctomycetota bacterium]